MGTKPKHIDALLKDKVELALIIQILNKDTKEILWERIDELEFIRLVKHHRLDSVLFLEMTKQNIKAPDKLQASLENINKQNKMRMMKLTAELIRIHQIFTENSIDYISLKGPALSQQIYGDYTIRSSRDLDILVNPKEVSKAQILLESIGYKTSDTYTKLSKLNDKELKFFNSDKNTLVELHHRLFNNKYLFPFSSDIFNTLNLVGLNAVKIPSFSNSDNFLYITTHAAAHNWSRLTWVLDVLAYQKLMQPEDLQKAESLSKKDGLQSTYKQATESTIFDFVCVSNEKHYRLLKRMQHLLSLNSKYRYKKHELLQRLMIPYRYITRMLKQK